MAMIANHLVQSTIFALVAGLLTLFLRNNHARTRYWIWLTASLKFLIPFSLFVELGHRLTWSTAPVITQPGLATAIDTISQPFTIATASPVVSKPTTTSLFLPAIWICGSAAVLIFWFVRWRRAAAMRRTSDPRLEPGVFGVFRPVLYLPPGVADHLSDEQLNAIVAHELCHIRCRDNLTAALHMLVEAVFWFHPLVWWIGTRLVDERERACDEEVVRMGSDPEIYAESILKVCKLYLESPLACVSGVTGSDLKKRIEAIMINRVLRGLNPAKKVAFAIVGLATLALPVLVGIVHAQSATPKYEVASIRPSHDCADGMASPVSSVPGGMPAMLKGGPPPPPPPPPRDRAITSTGRLSQCRSLADLIHMAYITYADGHYHPVWGPPLEAGPQLEGGPAWVRSESYRIDATAPGASIEMLRGPVLQAILEERFRLKIRHIAKDVPVYALTVAKGGPKLQASKIDCFESQPEAPNQTPKPGLPACQNRVGPMMLQMQAGTIEGFLQMLGGVLNRPIIDRTGITGKFNVHIEFSIDDSMRKRPPVDLASDAPLAPSIVAVLKQQLGLKLEATKGPIEFLAIDHVERPSAN